MDRSVSQRFHNVYLIPDASICFGYLFFMDLVRNKMLVLPVKGEFRDVHHVPLIDLKVQESFYWALETYHLPPPQKKKPKTKKKNNNNKT